MKSRFLALGVIMVCIVLGTYPAAASQSDWVKADYMKARLIAADAQGGAVDLAVQVQIDAGWHSYWRNPGDAGAPPRFDWAASENVADVAVSWQAPKRYDEFGFQTFGYSNDVYFPLVVTPKETSKPVTLNVTVQTMVCSDICIPQVFTMNADLPAGDGVLAAQSKIIEFEKRRIPSVEDIANLKLNSAVIGPDALVINVYAHDGFDDFDVFATGDEIAFTIIPEITINKDDARTAMIKLPKPEDIDDLNAALKDQELSITIVSARRAIERKISF